MYRALFFSSGVYIFSVALSSSVSIFVNLDWSPVRLVVFGASFLLQRLEFVGLL